MFAFPQILKEGLELSGRIHDCKQKDLGMIPCISN